MSPTRENLQRTLVLCKPDAVSRGLVGRILTRFESRGLQLLGLKLLHMDEARAERLYEPHVGKGFYAPLIKYMTSGPIVALVLEGYNAIDLVRTMMGATNPAQASPGTIRGDFAQRMDRNVVHGSDSLDNAAREIAIFFDESELPAGEAHHTLWL